MSFLSSLLPTIIGAGAVAATGGAAAPWVAGGLGALQYKRTGSLQKGLLAGLGAYGGASLASGLAEAGAANIGEQALTSEAGRAQAAERMLGGAAENEARSQVMKEAAVNATPFEKFSSGLSGLGQKGGLQAAQMGMTQAGGLSAGQAGLAATAPMMFQSPQQTPTPAGDSAMPQRLQYNVGRPVDAQGRVITPQPDVPGYGGLGQDFGRQQNYFPTAGFQNITAEQARQMRGYAGGGPVESMSNANALGENTGYPQADISGHAYAVPWQTPVSQNVVQGSADTGVNRMTGQMLAGGGVTGEGNLDLHIPLDFGGSGGFGGGNSATVYPVAGSGTSTQTGFMGQNNTAGGGFGAQPNSGSPFGSTPFNDPTNSDTFKGTAAFGGNPQEALKTLFGALGGQTQQNPFQQNAPLQMATGGIADAYAAGGMSHLGDYSDGGRLLKGPGDGVSDSIPATIGNKRPARLADGEFVVPARIVSELGNGSTDAGARKLYAMLDRVQAARKKSIGKGKVAKNSRADKLLPA